MIGLALILMQSVPAATFEADEVPEHVLAQQRGGFRLPSGIEVALSIDSRTALDGAIILQTIVKIDEGAPVIAVYAPVDGQEIAMEDVQAGFEGSAVATVTYDGQNGLVVSKPFLSPAVTVGGGEGGAAVPVAGLQELDLSAPRSTATGEIRKTILGAAEAIEYSSSDLRVLHLIGNAYGSAILNSGSDRTIDTQTTISIDLRNAGPDVLGATMFRVENLAIEAVSGRF